MRARADRDHGLRVARGLLQNGLRRPPADRGVDTVILERNGAGDDEQILTLVLGHRALQRGFGLMAGGGHDVVLIIEGHDVEHEIADRRLGRPQYALHAPGAFLEREPHHGGASLRGERRGDSRRQQLGEAERSGHLGAEREKVAATHTATFEILAERFFGNPGMRRGKEHACLPALLIA